MPELGTYTPVTPATEAARRNVPIPITPMARPIARTSPTYTPTPTTPTAPTAGGTDFDKWFFEQFGTLPTTTGAAGGYPQPAGRVPADQFGRTATWDVGNGLWRYPPDWAVDPVTLQAGFISPADQAGIDLQEQMFGELSAWQEAQLGAAEKPEQWRPGELALEQGRLAAQQQYYQWQQQQAENAYKAQLAAQPKSWLEYAAYTGQEPVVQPWMLPLMPQEYGLQTGQPIPGYTEESMAGMPSLLNPSAQYLARMGPTAQQQLYGYQQAQTGAMPEETAWRQWSAAPPGGGATQLGWAR